MLQWEYFLEFFNLVTKSFFLNRENIFSFSTHKLDPKNVPKLLKCASYQYLSKAGNRRGPQNLWVPPLFPVYDWDPCRREAGQHGALLRGPCWGGPVSTGPSPHWKSMTVNFCFTFIQHRIIWILCIDCCSVVNPEWFISDPSTTFKSSWSRYNFKHVRNF